MKNSLIERLLYGKTVGWIFYTDDDRVYDCSSKKVAMKCDNLKLQKIYQKWYDYMRATRLLVEDQTKIKPFSIEEQVGRFTDNPEKLRKNTLELITEAINEGFQHQTIEMISILNSSDFISRFGVKDGGIKRISTVYTFIQENENLFPLLYTIRSKTREVKN